MSRGDHKYSEDWFKIGNRELKRAEILSKWGDISGAALNIQQALEKYLKGYLLSYGWKLRKIHDLEILLNDTIGFDPSFEEFRASCQKITQYYLEERYPVSTSSELNEDEIIMAMKITKKIISRIKRKIK